MVFGDYERVGQYDPSACRVISMDAAMEASCMGRSTVERSVDAIRANNPSPSGNGLRLEKALLALQAELEKARTTLWLTDKARITESLALAAKDFQDELERLGRGTELNDRASITSTLSAAGSPYADSVAALSGVGLEEYEPFFYQKSKVRKRAVLATRLIERDALDLLRMVTLLLQRTDWNARQRAALHRWQRELDHICQQAIDLHSQGCEWLSHCVELGKQLSNENAPCAFKVASALTIGEPALSLMAEAAIHVTQSLLQAERRVDPKAQATNVFLEQPTETVADDVPQWDKITEARNKWLYEQCKNGKKYSAIIADLKNKPKSWARLEHPNSIKKAAEAYAARKQLQPIPRRSAGRPKQK